MHQEIGELTIPRRERIHMLYNARLESAEEEAERQRNPLLNSVHALEDRFYKYCIETLSARGYDPVFHLLRLSNYKEVIKTCVGDPKNQEVVFVFCDGTEYDGYPGRSVCKYLEEEGYLSIGPSYAFGEITVDKQKQKDTFKKHGVSTAPYLNISEWNEDIEQQIINGGLKYPLFVKVAKAYGSYGLSDKSVVRNFDEVREQVQKILNLFGSVVLEEFILGREFTVFISDKDDDVYVYPPVEQIFDVVDPYKKFQSYETAWRNYDEITTTVLVKEPELARKVADVTRAAYKACNGNSFARVDLRMRDETGEVFALEVNDLCSVGPTSTVDRILKLNGQNSADFIEAQIKRAIARRAPTH